MLLRLILWLLARQITALNTSDKRFQYAIRTTSLVLQFTLQNGKAIRYFDFKDGRFRSASGPHADISSAQSRGMLGERVAILSFSSAFRGALLLIKSSSDDTIMLNAIRKKQLRVEGDFTAFMWFGWLGKQLK